MNSISNYVLTKDYNVCDASYYSNNQPTLFLLTTDKEFYHEQKSRFPENKIALIDIFDKNSIETAFQGLKKFISGSFTDIVLHCHGEKLDLANCLPYYEFTYEFLTFLQSNKCNCLLISQSVNTLGALIHGGALSLSLESPPFRYCYLETTQQHALELPTLFNHCFQHEFQQYRYENNCLFQLEWKENQSHPAQPFHAKNILITGGSGAIGKVLTKYFVDQFQSQVFIVGRRKLDALLTNQLKDTGAKAYFQADCTDYAAMTEVIDLIENKHGKIDAIFHLAGEINDELLRTKTKLNFIKTLKQKVSGALVIEKLAAEIEIKYVVLFSSISAIVGNIGQVDYSSANSFLNALAEYHGQINNGTKWYSINWGLWDTLTGMQMQENSMLNAMSQQNALQSLHQVLQSRNIISTIFKGKYDLIKNIRPHENTFKTNNNTLTLPLMPVIEWVREIIVKYTKLRNINNDDSLLEMGVDSIIAINIASHLSEVLSTEIRPINIPKTLLFQYSTIQTISEYLLNHFSNELQRIVDVQEHKQNIEAPVLAQDRSTANAQEFTRDDIAIIGIAGEFPGADNINDFWKLLQHGESAINVIPASRWNWRNYFSLDSQFHSRHGGFINHAEMFDAKFFKIPPIDAERMDPQARRLLHQTYIALSDAKFFDNTTQNVGVFVAAMYNHYQNLDNENELINSSFSAISNHLSYFFNFTGPSLAVDTMCSGSLSALHLAINSLKLNECSIAIVGGVNIMCHPGKFQFLSKEKFLSPTGHCHTFGVSADGYVPGEGAISLVLKPLKHALKDNNNIYAVIRGSALNSIGRGSAFTVPSASAQSSVIKKALEQANLNPEDISYIEAHGTGTALGDPIEIEGLNTAYGFNQEKPCSVGSVKSNIGHLESAAGLASIVKVILQMHYRKLVPSLHCTIENPHLPLHQSRLKIQKTLQDWNNEDHTVYAGISGFGAGGSNAHIILQSPSASHRHDKIIVPDIKFNEKPYLANTFKFNNQIQVKNTVVDEIDPILFTSSIKECQLSSEPDNQTPLLILLDETQEHLFNAKLNISKIIINHDAIWEEKLKNTLADNNKKNIVIVNFYSLRADSDTNNAALQLHFKLAKLLSKLTLPIHYIHFVRETTSTISCVKIKSLSSIFRTLSIEKSNFKMTLLESDDNIQNIILNLHSTTSTHLPYRHLIYKNNQWHHQHYLELPRDTKQTTLLKEGGIYLIAGGLGAIGIAISEMLMQKYNATVIILGRSELSGDKLEKFNALLHKGGKVEYVITDITNREKVNSAIEYILNRYGKLNGIVQSACVLNDGLFDDKTYSDFNAVLQSKIDGTKNLDEASSHISLDFFVMFSSISSIYGNVGQADYCVANTFLDEFAKLRKAQTISGARSGTTISINWPIWQVAGLNLDQATIEFISESTGLEPLSTNQGLKLFEAILTTNIPQQIIPFLGNKDKIREKINIRISHPAQNAFTIKDNTILTDLIKIICKITKLDATDIQSTLSISDIGMNSILLAELASAIQNQFDINISPSLFFSYNTIAKIADYLMTKLNKLEDNTTDLPVVTPVIQLQDESDEYAIIGLDALLPGGPDVSTFWKSLLENKSFISKMERWKEGEYYAATLPDIDKFDPKFFNLSNREAVLMDPQHRLFLLTVYNAILNGGYTPSQLKNVGVFVGVQFSDYQGLLQQRHKSNHVYSATGNAHAMLANRVSYMFDFNGPSQTIDTACSSALVAINRGLLALKNHECDHVITGAVSLLIDPVITEAAKSMGILSPRFRCATFDEEADGYVRGEGVGCFIIKRLNDAIKDKDPIHAVIKSFAENHGGKANTLTSPNPIAQKELLLKAYTNELASQVSYIETHGTGTKLGDPVEIDALTQAFSQLRPDAKANSIHLGAVKTNVGHLEPAAAIPSLIKVIFALKNKLIPANINYQKRNSFINLTDTPFTLLTNNTSWKSPHPLVAGISSFGFGGSNTHIVLKEYITNESIINEYHNKYLFTLSARTEKSLQIMRSQLADYLQNSSGLPLSAISFTLNKGRDHFNHRFAFVTNSIDELINALNNNNYLNVTCSTQQEKNHPSGKDHDEAMLFYLQGNEIDWDTLYGSPSNKIHLPGYVFDMQSYWYDIEEKVEMMES